MKKIASFDFLLNGNISWPLKRRLLNILWVLINLVVLSVTTHILLESGWEIIWGLGVLVYSSISWILADMLFNSLIGDEFNQKNNRKTDELK